eukprot:scaffold806_cov229-Pinguiococcus_pyrenoidosus.AAC.3
MLRVLAVLCLLLRSAHAQVSMAPTVEPTMGLDESVAPTLEPTLLVVSGAPSEAPSSMPSVSAPPSYVPSPEPSWVPTAEPSTEPSAEPSAAPSWEPSTMPTAEPSGTPSVSPDGVVATVALDFGDNLSNSSAVLDAIDGVVAGILAVMPEGVDVNVEVIMTTTEETSLFINGATLPEDVRQDILDAVIAIRCPGLLTCTVEERSSERRRLQLSEFNVDAETSLNENTDLSQSRDFDDPDFVSAVNGEADSGTLASATVTSRSTTAEAVVSVPSGTPADVVESVEDASQDTEAIQESVESETGTEIEDVAVSIPTAAPTEPEDDDDDDDDDGLSGGAIAGIVIGVTVFVGAVVVGGFLFYQSRAEQPRSSDQPSTFAGRVTETEVATGDAA